MVCDGVALVAYATLGPVVADWIQRHCVIPDGPQMGDPFVLTDEMRSFVDNFYAVDLETRQWCFARGGQLIRPQKWGKGPFSAALICAEAAGPVLPVFDKTGDLVDGRPWDTPWIQVTAISEDQTANVFRALLPMIQLSDSLNMEIADTGLTRVNLPGGGLIEPVTASARSRLGQRITFVVQDEALALDTPLPTPTGWTTMGDVRAGDRLLGADGNPVTVVRATEVQTDRDCYRVTFADDSSVVTSDGHLWHTKVASSAAKPKVRTTGEMVRDGRRFRIPVPRPYELPVVDLPVDPYVLGYWLGDGSTGQAYLTVGEIDLTETLANLRGCGFEPRVARYADRAPSVKLSNGSGYQGADRPANVKALQALACYRRKHVPVEYFRGSREQREALLQGLMDSDGHITVEGHCTFVGNDQLSADVQCLLRTLGIMSKRVWRENHEYRSGGIWKVNFVPRHGVQPFRLRRKADRVRDSRDSDWVSIVRIEPVESVPVRCVEVDAPDHLFLAGEAGHVTHNTHSWIKTNGGLTLADNQRRNLAGMSGRFLETTNAFDPVEGSVAQRTFESKASGTLLDDREPPPGSVRNKRERRKVLKHVYGDSWWVNLDRIDAEIEALLEHDPAQAERFFLNRKMASEGAAFDVVKFRALERATEVPDGSVVTLGVDGARFDDALAVVATDARTGHQWLVSVQERPKDAGPDYEHDLEQVDQAVSEVFDRFTVWRVYCDPHYIDVLLDRWRNRWGEKRIVGWPTYRPRPIAFAIRAYQDAIANGDVSWEDNTGRFLAHVTNSRKKMLETIKDDRERPMHTLAKPSHRSPLKIDIAMAAVLSWEARGDVIAMRGVNLNPEPLAPEKPKPVSWTPGKALPSSALTSGVPVGPLGPLS